MWVALAAAIACAAAGLAISEVALPSFMLALIGVPLAAYATLASLSRVQLLLSVVALAADILILGYWIYFITDALQGAR